jgi:hypothetical protein
MAYDLALASVAGGVTGIIGLMLLDRNWFRREEFKIDRDFRKKEIDLKLKKLARDLGLDKKVVTPAQTAIPNIQNSTMDTLKTFAPLLSKLAPEQIQDLLDRFLPGGGGGEFEDEVGGGIPEGLGGLLEFASKNPALVDGFLKGLGGEPNTNNPQKQTAGSQV